MPTRRRSKRLRTKQYQKIAKNIHPILQHEQLKFVIAKYADPQSRFYARIALNELGWIPQQVLQYVKEKTEKGESLRWNHDDNLAKVMKEDKFELVKWACTFNTCVKNSLCQAAACYGKLHMLQWARKQQPPLPWNVWTLYDAFDDGQYDTLKWALENGCEEFNRDMKNQIDVYAQIFENEDRWKNVNLDNTFISIWDHDLGMRFDCNILMMAVMFGHKEFVRYLLTRNGIDVNYCTESENSAIQLAEDHNRHEIAKMIRSHPNFSG
eukprot:g4363.t1